ncbi:hypothetical protein ACFPVT_09545 [Corynebacterium choanae]|uniref:Uncharacterized protein n=1 Tax=Corynebacterium choanae TaxID=1862358 RepID=A0A3G6J8E6_9CORY|nr:hypothetical protein [Corynebacterium choanae]AZA14266.1 hypothetical protein CCHOA_09415 [Corynebacterium choanae]
MSNDFAAISADFERKLQAQLAKFDATVTQAVQAAERAAEKTLSGQQSGKQSQQAQQSGFVPGTSQQRRLPERGSGLPSWLSAPHRDSEEQAGNLSAGRAMNSSLRPAASKSPQLPAAADGDISQQVGNGGRKQRRRNGVIGSILQR